MGLKTDPSFWKCNFEFFSQKSSDLILAIFWAPNCLHSQKPPQLTLAGDVSAGLVHISTKVSVAKHTCSQGRESNVKARHVGNLFKYTTSTLTNRLLAQ